MDAISSIWASYPLFFWLLVVISIVLSAYPVKLGIYFTKTSISWTKSWWIMLSVFILQWVLGYGFFIFFKDDIPSWGYEWILSGLIISSIIFIVVCYFIIPYIVLRVFKIRLGVKKFFLYLLWSIFIPFVIAFSFAFLVKLWILPIHFNGSSMEPTLHDKDYILINRFDKELSRNDMVIFKVGNSNYIKRIIWLPGETIKFESGSVFIKGSWSSDFQKIDEPYLSPINKDKTFFPVYLEQSEFLIPSHKFWVMGDNRMNSADSRSCFSSCQRDDTNHFVRDEDIIGKLIL